MSAVPHVDPLIRLRRDRRSLLNMQRRAAANPDSLAGYLAPNVRAYYFRDRAAVMAKVRLP